MTNPTNTRIPAPLYAAAGVSDLAFQQLLKLPAVMNDLRDKAAAGLPDLRERAAATLKAANATATDLRDKATTADLDRFREAAKRNATALVAGAQTVYTQLVARGERVVGGGVVQAADAVNADIETTTEAPAELTSPKPAAKATTTTAAKPVKRARPAATK